VWPYYIIIVYLCICDWVCIMLLFHSIFLHETCLFRTSMWSTLVFRIDKVYDIYRRNTWLIANFFMITNSIYLVCCFVYCHIWSTCFTQPFIFGITSYIDISIIVNYYCLNCIFIINYEHVAYVLYVILVNISFITKHIKTII